jgi:hypothetical protein
MNTPYISLQAAFEVIDKVVNEYDSLIYGANTPEEKHVGRVGLTAALKIKKGLLRAAKERERDFD